MRALSERQRAHVLPTLGIMVLTGLAAGALWGTPALDEARGAGPPAPDGPLPERLALPYDDVAPLREGDHFEPIALVAGAGAGVQVAVGAETGEVRRLDIAPRGPRTAEVSLSSDGTVLAYGLDGARANADPQLRVWDVEAGETHDLPLAHAAGGHVDDVLVSPDGANAAVEVRGPSFSARGTVVVDLDSGTSTTIDARWLSEWTADGAELIPFSDFDMYAVDARTGDQRRVIEQDAGENRTASLSPDEETVVQWRSGAEGDGPFEGHVIEVSTGDDATLDSDTTADLTPGVLGWLDDDTAVLQDPGDGDYEDATPPGEGLVLVDVSEQRAVPLLDFDLMPTVARRVVIAPDALAAAAEGGPWGWWTRRPWVLSAGAAAYVLLAAGLVTVGLRRRR